MHMTFAELLCRTDAYCERRILEGSAEQTFEIIRSGRHADPQFRRILSTLTQWCAIREPNMYLQRSEVVNALGPMRLRLSAEAEATPAYQALIQFIRAVDAAYDDKVLDGEPDFRH